MGQSNSLIVEEKTDSCTDCAAGGPCSCDYLLYRSALQNATSSAAMILTTEVLITDLPEY